MWLPGAGCPSEVNVTIAVNEKASELRLLEKARLHRPANITFATYATLWPGLRAAGGRGSLLRGSPSTQVGRWPSSACT